MNLTNVNFYNYYHDLFNSYNLILKRSIFPLTAVITCKYTNKKKCKIFIHIVMTCTFYLCVINKGYCSSLTENSIKFFSKMKAVVLIYKL